MKLIEPGWKPLLRVPAATETYSSVSDVGKTLGDIKINTFALAASAGGTSSGSASLYKKGASGASLTVTTNAYKPGTLSDSASAVIGLKTISPIDGFHAVITPTFVTLYWGSGSGFSSTPIINLKIYDYSNVLQTTINLRQYAIPTAATSFASPNGLGISIIRNNSTQVNVYMSVANDYTNDEFAGYATQTVTVGAGFYVELETYSAVSTSGNTAPLNVTTEFSVYDPVYKEL